MHARRALVEFSGTMQDLRLVLRPSGGFLKYFLNSRVGGQAVRQHGVKETPKRNKHAGRERARSLWVLGVIRLHRAPRAQPVPPPPGSPRTAHVGVHHAKPAPGAETELWLS